MKTIYFYKITAFPSDINFETKYSFIKIGEANDANKRHKIWLRRAKNNGYEFERLPFIIEAESDKEIHSILRRNLFLQVVCRVAKYMITGENTP